MNSSLVNTCRCCLNTTENNLLNMMDHFLFDETTKETDTNKPIIDSYFCCTGVNKKSCGPFNICHSCKRSLQKAFRFREQCQQSNEKFQNLWIKEEVIHNLEKPECSKLSVNIICNDIKISDKYSVSEVLIEDEIKSEPNSDDDDLPLAERIGLKKITPVAIKADVVDESEKTPSKKNHNILENELITDTEERTRKRRHKPKRMAKKKRKSQHTDGEVEVLEPVTEEDKREDVKPIKVDETDAKSDVQVDAGDDWQTNDDDKGNDSDNKTRTKSTLLEKVSIMDSKYVCLICDKEFRNFNGLHGHRKRVHSKNQRRLCTRDCLLCEIKQVRDYMKHLAEIHPEYKPNECAHCKESFLQFNDLKLHLYTHVSGSNYQCLGCNSFHSSEAALRKHINFAAHNSVKIGGTDFKQSFNCHICGLALETVTDLQNHVNVSHPKESTKKFYPCFHCKKSFTSRVSYRYNFTKKCSQRKAAYESKKKRLNQVKKFECKDCDKKFYEEEDLLCHTISIHKNTIDSPFCTQCAICFQTTAELRKHMKKEHKDKYKEAMSKKNYMCAECGKCCDSKGRLQQHAVSHVDDRPCKCDKCPAAFKHPSNLRSHMKLHTVKRDIECNECGKFFTSLHYVKVHLSRCHFPSIRRFKCDVCPRTMTTVTEKKRHQRTHTGERPFKCNICERSYATEAGLTGHVQTNHTLIRYECKFCDKKLALKISMWKHIFSHRGYYPYNCPVCNYGCFPKELIKRHMQKHHNLEYDEETHGYHAETFDEVIASGIKVTAENAPNFRPNQVNLNNEINYLNYVAMETIEKEMQPPGPGHKVEDDAEAGGPNFMQPPPQTVENSNYIPMYDVKPKYIHQNE